MIRLSKAERQEFSKSESRSDGMNLSVGFNPRINSNDRYAIRTQLVTRVVLTLGSADDPCCFVLKDIREGFVDKFGAEECG